MIDTSKVRDPTKDALLSELMFQKTHSERLQTQLKDIESENHRLDTANKSLKKDIKYYKEKIDTLIVEQKSLEKYHKRKLAESDPSKLIEEMTDYFRQIKKLEQELRDTKIRLEESRYISETKSKDIYALKSTIKELEIRNRLLDKKHNSNTTRVRSTTSTYNDTDSSSSDSSDSCDESTTTRSTKTTQTTKSNKNTKPATKHSTKSKVVETIEEIEDDEDEVAVSYTHLTLPTNREV